MANAKATNRDAIVFNPAIPNYKKYGLIDSKYTAKASSYVVKEEILSSAYIAAEVVKLSPYTPMTPGILDDLIAIASYPVLESEPFWKTVWLQSENGSPIGKHMMDSVINAMGGKNY